MNELITKATPLLLALLLGLVRVVSNLVSYGPKLTDEHDVARRKKLALALLLTSLPPALCLSAFSYDIWALTTLFAGDANILQRYNIKDKFSAVQLLLVVHIVLYIAVVSWGVVLRRGETTADSPKPALEIALGVTSILLCIWFQVY